MRCWGTLAADQGTGYNTFPGWGTTYIGVGNLPKHAHSLLVWSAEREIYELREGNQTTVPDADAWTRWLDDHSSFAFQGRNGRLNMLKEQRKAGPGYWYAYRRQSGRVAKRYAGRGSELTWAHLEALALALGGRSETAVVPQPPAEAGHTGGEGGRARADPPPG